MRRFQVDSLPAAGARTTLDAAASHHLLQVMRHARGAALVLFDGSGRQAEGVLIEVADGRAVIEVTSAANEARPKEILHLIVGIPKGPAMDLAVRMATESGATDIHPVLAKRSVARGDRADRWRRIAESAAQQCGRADVPIVHGLASLADALTAVAGSELRIALPGAARLAAATGPAAVLVGPEGGWTEAETSRALAAGARAVGYGAWVLRTDTACAVAVSATAPTDPSVD